MAEDKVISMFDYQKSMTSRAREAVQAAFPDLHIPRVLEDCDLPSTGNGERPIGSLLPDETELAIVVDALDVYHDSLGRRMSGATLQITGQEISRSSSKNEVDMDTLQKRLLQEHELDLCNLFQCEQRLRAYSGALYLGLYERLGYWDYRIAVRAGGKVVTTEKRIPEL